MSFSFSNIFAGLLFSGIGFVAFSYGKREGRFALMAFGGVMMAYPYFTPGAAWTWGIGLALSVILYLFRDSLS